MKSGFDMLEHEEDFDEEQIDFLRKTVSIMKILTQEAIKTAERFVKACGRSQITGNDIYYALMYEAHEFFDKDIDNRFFEELLNEREHTYLTDDESGSEDEESHENDEEKKDDRENETYTVNLKIESEADFHHKIIDYANEWRNWFPEDPVKLMIKKAIDNTRNNIENREND